MNLRGTGLFLCFDCPTVEKRDKLLSSLKSKGVLLGANGTASIRLRPTLVFEKTHANILLNSLEESLNEL